MKILFLLKRREITVDEIVSVKPRNYCISTGLRNSVYFLLPMLKKIGHEGVVREVTDNNDIDREVTDVKPDVCIIEAFWVVPEKFDVLKSLHPNVVWIVRNHSEIPFLANEGIAIDWIIEYLKRGVFVASNSMRTVDDFMLIGDNVLDPEQTQVIYLPNYYHIKCSQNQHRTFDRRSWINVGCFGAIRPLKNHLTQALAAVRLAQILRKGLYFHINVSRIEDEGNQALKNLRALFAKLTPRKYQLVEHSWRDHDEFLKIVSQMDIGFQTSFTESFNIVTADFVAVGVPIVVSDEINWMPERFMADETNSVEIASVAQYLLLSEDHSMEDAMGRLKMYNQRSERQWARELSDLTT